MFIRVDILVACVHLTVVDMNVRLAPRWLAPFILIDAPHNITTCRPLHEAASKL